VQRPGHGADHIEFVDDLGERDLQFDLAAAGNVGGSVSSDDHAARAGVAIVHGLLIGCGEEAVTAMSWCEDTLKKD